MEKSSQTFLFCPIAFLFEKPYLCAGSLEEVRRMKYDVRGKKYEVRCKK